MSKSKEDIERRGRFGTGYNETQGFLAEALHRRDVFAAVPEQYKGPEMAAADFSFNGLFLGDVITTTPGKLNEPSVSFMVTDIPPYQGLTEGRVLTRPITVTVDGSPYERFDENLYGSFAHEVCEDKFVDKDRGLLMVPVPASEGASYSFPFDTFRLISVLPDEEAVRLSQLYKEQHERLRDAAIFSGTAIAFGAVVFSSLVASGGSGGPELTVAAAATGALAYGKRSFDAFQRENAELRAGVVKRLSEVSPKLGELLGSTSKYVFFSPQ